MRRHCISIIQCLQRLVDVMFLEWHGFVCLEVVLTKQLVLLGIYLLIVTSALIALLIVRTIILL